MNLESQLTQLENAQLIRHLIEDEPAYLFRHALTQDTAYQSLLKQSRRTIHRQVAQTLERIYADRLDESAALLAHHYDQAGADVKTVEYAIRAGDAAARVFAYPEARSQYTLALEKLARLPDDGERQQARVDTVLKYVSVSLRAEGPAETLKRLEQVETLARDLASRADATRADRVRLARVRYWQGHAFMHQNEMRAAFQTMRQVLAVAREVDDPQLLAVPARVIGVTLVAQGQFGQAEAVLAEAVSALEHTNDADEWILAVGMYAVAMTARGDYAGGVAEAERALARANESNTLTGLALAHRLLGLTHLFGGEFALALAHTRAVIKIAARSGDQLLSYIGYGFHAWSQLGEGLCAQADESLAHSAEFAQKIGGRLIFSDWIQAIRAERAIACGQLDESIALAEESVRAAFNTESIFAAALAHRVWGKALASLNSPQTREADIHLGASLRLFESGDARLEAARTHVAWGKVLSAPDEQDSAREHFAKAAAQFEASGLDRELGQVRALLSPAISS